MKDSQRRNTEKEDSDKEELIRSTIRLTRWEEKDIERPELNRLTSWKPSLRMTDGKKMNEESLSSNHRLRREGRKRRNVSMGKAKRASMKEDDDLFKINYCSSNSISLASRSKTNQVDCTAIIKMINTHIQFTPIQSR